MKKFNTSDLITGYIKQLLKSFNLPKVKIYTDNHLDYLINNNEESPEILRTVQYNSTDTNVRYFPYIRNGEFQEYIDGNWVNLGTINPTAPKYYVYDQKILNYTKNLQIDSNVYDSYTHEYLGDYLRFHRDYSNINLMSLYNCFSNRACEKLNYKWNIVKEKGGRNITNTISFDTSDDQYKIYMVPVKLFQKYTIAIDSIYPVEFCCGIYGDYQDPREKFIHIPARTYKKVSTSLFSQPILFNELSCSLNGEINTFVDRLTDSEKIEIAQNEQDLKLFIKLPKDNTSTIVVLEGDYINWNDSIWRPFTATANTTTATGDKLTNKTVINLESVNNDAKLKLISPLQLLMFNTGEQHPFADRLIEYLVGNAITNADDEIYDNVRRAQKALANNRTVTSFRVKYPGVWSNNMNKLFYEYITSNVNTFEANHDILGYVDKDVEKYYQVEISEIINGRTHKSYTSLSNLELEEGDK